MQFSSDVQVTLIRGSAADFDVVRAARVSTIGTESVNTESANGPLINYLMRDRHGSPFEHTSFTFMVKAPIFVAREFMRHRAGWSYNEESGRYRELKPEFYIPADDRPLKQIGKPGAYTFEPGTEAQHQLTSEEMRWAYGEAYETYLFLLSNGIAREVARMVLPVGIFTTFYATCNARSLMHFLSLRTKRENARVASFPQREIEMVAEQMEATFQTLMPLTFEAFERHGRVGP
jgi:thymidylate synthase (FAD)